MGCGCKNNQQTAQQQEQLLQQAQQNQQNENVANAVKQTIEKYYQKPKG
jgi:hypothetical protein